MFSQFDRQTDKRLYGCKRNVFTGAMWIPMPERINPYRAVKWNEQGLLEYELIPGCEPPKQEEDEEEEEEE